MTKNLRLLPVDSDDIPHILKDVRDSRCFGRSQRQVKLFEYLLEHSRADNKVQPSQYSIALDVIGRPESFDAATDSIVRVEMHRLRANLEVYNNSDSKYKISIPPASFAVEVSPRQTHKRIIWDKNVKTIAIAGVVAITAVGTAFSLIGPQAPPAPDACAQDRPNLYITYDGAASAAKDYVKSVLRSTVSQQTVFNVINTVQPCGKTAAPTYNLQIDLLENEEALNLSINVVERAQSTIVESHHLTGLMADTGPETDLYFKIAEIGNSIAMPSSTLARDAHGRQWGSADYRQSYGCLISMYDSFAGELENEFKTVLDCLEYSAANGQPSLDTYGALASIYLYQARNNKGSTDLNPLRAAEDILDEYGHKWIDSHEIAIAKIYYEAHRPDFNAERMLLTLGMIKAKYNTNPQVLLNVASFYGISLGRWGEAKALSDYVKDIYSVRDQSVYTVDAGYALLTQGEGSDMTLCYEYYSETSVFSNIIVNSCARQAKDEFWLSKTETNLAALNMAGSANRVAYITSHIRDSRILQKVVNLQTIN